MAWFLKFNFLNTLKLKHNGVNFINKYQKLVFQKVEKIYHKIVKMEVENVEHLHCKVGSWKFWAFAFK